MVLILGVHARKRVAERELRLEWIEAAVTSPDLRRTDPADPSLT